MKKRKVKKLSLEKMTIAKINPGAMGTIHGGSSIPTSILYCKETGETVCEDSP